MRPRSAIEVLDGKQPYQELFEPLKKPLERHLRSMYKEFSTTTADVNTVTNTWDDNSSTSSSHKATTVWFNEEPIDKSSRHEIAQTTVTHDSEDDRFAFFNAVCTRLSSLQETKSSSESEEAPQKEKQTPYGADGFAPPPQNARHNNLPKRFESLYRKKRQSQQPASDSSGFGSNASDFWSFERYGRSNHGTLERSNRPFPGNNNGFSTLQPKKRSGGENQKMTVELRYENDVPMVAKIAGGQAVTLRYFRHLFGIQYSENCRFFFKSTCEDGSAQYQWTLLFQDDELLPVFQNRISAICRLCAPPDDLI